MAKRNRKNQNFNVVSLVKKHWRILIPTLIVLCGVVFIYYQNNLRPWVYSCPDGRVVNWTRQIKWGEGTVGGTAVLSFDLYDENVAGEIHWLEINPPQGMPSEVVNFTIRMESEGTAATLCSLAYDPFFVDVSEKIEVMFGPGTQRYDQYRSELATYIDGKAKMVGIYWDADLFSQLAGNAIFDPAYGWDMKYQIWYDWTQWNGQYHIDYQTLGLFDEMSQQGYIVGNGIPGLLEAATAMQVP